MCGILCCFSPTDDKITSFTTRLHAIKHRGPDETRIKVVQTPNLTTFTCGFNRLAISDVLNGNQPFEHGDWVHVHNGEFYDSASTNPNIYQDEFVQPDICKESDSYKLKSMTSDNALDFPSSLNGIFAYCSYHKPTETLYVARDRVGVIPLYYVVETDYLPTANDKQTYERIWFASEAKALIGLGDIHMFPPNNLMVCSLQKKESSDCFLSVIMEYYEILPPYPTSNYTSSTTNFFGDLVNAVTIRIQDEVPWASALSGGLDSSIIASILARPTYFSDINVRTFCIGLENSKDLDVAQMWGSNLGKHFSIQITVEEALNSVEKVIWALETYDLTTIRAGIMNYLLAEKMKRFGIKVAYSGEGSDELFGGYLYFHHCPNADAMQKELIRKMEELCYYDCLRCNKAFAAHGIECRVPFLDRRFVDTVMKINPMHKLSSTHAKSRQEKYILRKEFAAHMIEMDYSTEQKIEEEDLSTIIYRQKDQFSDSVGKEWIEALIKEASRLVSDDELADAGKKYPFQTPQTKEAYRYRQIFEKLFKCSGEHFVKYDNNTVACSTSVGAEWVKGVKKDPTGNYVKESINKK